MVEHWPLMIAAAVAVMLRFALQRTHSDLWSIRHDQLYGYASVGVLLTVLAAEDSIPRGEWGLFALGGGLGLVFAVWMGYRLWQEL